MRVIHDNKWTDEEIENFRQQVFNNLTHGMRAVLEAVEYNDLNVLPENEVNILRAPANIHH
jgi:guanine nucleotide-binding protein subunit alpha, other